MHHDTALACPSNFQKARDSARCPRRATAFRKAHAHVCEGRHSAFSSSSSRVRHVRIECFSLSPHQYRIDVPEMKVGAPPFGAVSLCSKEKISAAPVRPLQTVLPFWPASRSPAWFLRRFATQSGQPLAEGTPGMPTAGLTLTWGCLPGVRRVAGRAFGRHCLPYPVPGQLHVTWSAAHHFPGRQVSAACSCKACVRPPAASSSYVCRLPDYRYPNTLPITWVCCEELTEGFWATHARL